MLWLWIFLRASSEAIWSLSFILPDLDPSQEAWLMTPISPSLFLVFSLELQPFITSCTTGHLTHNMIRLILTFSPFLNFLLVSPPPQSKFPRLQKPFGTFKWLSIFKFHFILAKIELHIGWVSPIPLSLSRNLRGVGGVSYVSDLSQWCT